MADIREGQTATNPKTQQKVIFRGGQWHSVEGTAPGGPVLAKEDRNKLNELNDAANQAGEVKKQYELARQSLQELKPGPMRGRLLEMGIPEDNGGAMDTIGGALIGGPLGAFGYITPKDVENFQKVRGIQSQAVQQKQTLQKGVQTEGDAARIMLSDISPTKEMAVNDQIMNAGTAQLDRQQGRADFYTKWANGYGSLSAVDPQGRSVDRAFQDAMTNGGFQQTDQSGKVVKRLKFNPATGEIE